MHGISSSFSAILVAGDISGATGSATGPHFIGNISGIGRLEVGQIGNSHMLWSMAGSSAVMNVAK